MDLDHRDFNHAAVFAFSVAKSAHFLQLLSCAVARLATAFLRPLAWLRILTHDTMRRHVACAVGIGWLKSAKSSADAL